MGIDIGGVDIWLFPFEAVDEALRRRCLSLLDASELDQLASFSQARPQDLYLLSRALVRLALSHHCGRPPQALRFTRDEHGRPWLASPDDALGLYFSLSHTDGLVALAVSGTPRIGLDVENLHRTTNFMGIAQSYFAASELSALNPLEGAAQRERFFDLWTVKEAYIKACGKGLRMPLDQFAVTVTPTSATLTESSDTGQARDGWQFFRAQPTPRHKLAVAASFPPHVPLFCRARMADLLKPAGL